MLEPHDGLRPSIARAILQCRGERGDRLRCADPSTIAVPGRLWPYGDTPTPAHGPVKRQLRRRPQRHRHSWRIHMLGSELELERDGEAIAVSFDDAVRQHTPELN